MADEQKTKLRLEIAHVLFIDIVGYSKLLITEQGELLRKLTEIVRQTEQFRRAESEGKLVRIPTGDGMALVFRDLPEAPTECALEISRALRSQRELQVRMGIHSGPVNEVVDVNDRANITGAGINLAQRVMDCGDAGHILLSKHVADDLEQYPQWRPLLHDLGECEVKHGARLHLVNLYDDRSGNSAIPVKCATVDTAVSAKKPSRVFRWSLVAAAALLLLGLALFATKVGNHRRAVQRNTSGAEGLPSGAPASIPEKSIAVLPFENLSRDPDNAYFADGIQEEILTRLAKIADLKVISRTSSQRYKSAPSNLSAIAQQLRVANVVEGSVQKSGDTVRVNVQLINALTDAHLWAETYDRKLTDAFAIESEIAKGVAEKLQANISGREEEVIRRQPTESSEAHELYLKGRYFWNKRTADGLKTSISYFNQAIEKDPAYAPAFAGLADAYAVLPNYSQTSGQEAYPKAEAAAMKALNLDDNLAEAHVALANIRIWHRWGKGAEDEFKKGLQLNPNYSTGHQWYSIYLSVVGRLTDAITEMEKARELDPFSIIINVELGCPYLYSGQYDRAISYFEKAVEMDRDFPFGHFALAEGYDRKGKYEEALTEHNKAIELAQHGDAIDVGGGDAPRAWYALTGELQNARRFVAGPNYWPDRLQAVKKQYEQGTTTASAVAEIYAVLGDTEQAFVWLEKAYNESDDFLVFVNIQPQFEKLHSDSRFETLVRRVFKSSVPVN